MTGIAVRAFYLSVASASLLAVTFALFSGILPTALGGYADQRFLQIYLSGVLTVASILFLAFRTHVPLQSTLRALTPTLLLAFSFLALSVPFARQAYAWVEPGFYGFYFTAAVLVGVCVSQADNSGSYARFFVCIAAAGCFIYGAMSINVYLFALTDGVTNLVDFIPWGFVNIRYWSHIATWFLPLLPLAVLVGPLKNQKLWRAAVAFGAGLWWWIIFLSTSRGSALGVVFGVILAAVLMGRQALPWLKQLVFYLIIGILFWLLLSVVIPSLMPEEVSLRPLRADSSGRMPLFVESLQMSIQKFPFGMGPQSWLTHEPLTDGYANSKKFGHPHNMYLMWAAEYGWFLILVLGWVVIQAIRCFWQRRAEVLSARSPERVMMLAGFTASVSGALFHAGISAVFMAPASMLVGMFVLSAFWALIVPGPDETFKYNVTEASARKRLLTGLLVAGITTVALWVWVKEVSVYYRDMKQYELCCQEEQGDGSFPRFWFIGNFPNTGYSTLPMKQ